MTLTVEPYKYQQELVDRLVESRIALVGDEMGLGKTLEAIALDDARRKGRFAKTLIIAPASVVPVWEEHLEWLVPDVPVIALNPKKRAAFLADLSKYRTGYFVVHWEALRLLIKDKTFFETKWFHIIADECHRMKNRKSQQTRALKRLKTYYRTAMSGTPADNHPHDLWSTLNWLKPTVYTGYWKFFDKYLDWEIQYPSGYRKVTGVKDADKLLAELKPFYMRRLKTQVLDLPEKTYTRIPIDLSPQQRREYNSMRADMIAWVQQQKAANKGELTPLVAQQTVVQLTRLQQLAVAYPGEIETKQVKVKLKQPRRHMRTGELITHEYREKTIVHLTDPSAKLDAIMEILEDADDRKQFVIFSQFKQAVNLLKVRLDAAGISSVVLTGDTPQTVRGSLVEQFQAGKARVFVGTIKAGGVGLTLTAASTIIFIDREWSPALNRQAEDRLHRIGQRNTVQIIDLVARNTVDLGRHQNINKKWSWIEQLLGDKVDEKKMTNELQTDKRFNWDGHYTDEELQLLASRGE